MWNNANLLSVEPSETNLNEIWIKIQTAHSRIHFKMTTMLSRAQRVKACLRNWGKSSRISYSNILYILLRYRMCPSLKTISISPVTHIYMRPIFPYFLTPPGETLGNLRRTWWRHQMETFSALLVMCGEFPAQRQVTRGFDVFFDLRLNKRLSKQSLVIWDAIAPIMTSL